MFALISDAFTLVRFGRPNGPHFGCELSDRLFIRTGQQDMCVVRQLTFHDFGYGQRHRIGKPHLQHQIGVVVGGVVLDGCKGVDWGSICDVLYVGQVVARRLLVAVGLGETTHVKWDEFVISVRPLDIG